MKVQYDLEGAQLNQSRWRCYCSKFVLAAILLVVLMLGSALATICFQRYREERHVPHVELSTEPSTTEEASTEIQEIAYIEINLDLEQGLSVNVNHDNGSLLTITKASGDLLKEFAGLVMAEAFAALRDLQEASSGKRVDIPELLPVDASTEEIWSWSTQESHDGFRIRFDNGEWSFGAVSRKESSEGKSLESDTEKQSVEVQEERISTEAPEEVWSWSSQGFSRFRINFADGSWSFETVNQKSQEESGSDKSEDESG